MIDARSIATDWLRVGRDDRIAVRDADRSITYSELRALVEARAGELGLSNRSVVVLTGDRCIEFVVTYLALLDGHHVPLLAADHVDQLAERWDVAAVVRATGQGWSIDRRDGTTPQLHPDLALLMSTSGSTGSPKLVRLSHDNVRSNAAAIADSLLLTETDHAISSLPLHYCYGLSVLHSHLSVGAGITVTETSVVDPCFHTLVHEHGVTTLAGVPHTFELLDRAGPESIAVPSLRLITQAGGRLSPDRVQRWRNRAAAWDVDFVVMYGQTEATARMAVMPPAVARRHPEAIGRAIPGGRLSLRPLDESAGLDPAVGELVYEGPNVMLGYADTLGDLALGRTVDELRTGDLARHHADDDVFEIVGRRARFIKPFGVRIDLAEIERIAADVGGVGEVAATGDDDGLVVATPQADAPSVRRVLASRTGLPPAAIAVDTTPGLPRTAAGKIDYPAIVERTDRSTGPMSGSTPLTTASPVTDVFADVLGRRGITGVDTFVGLGGDSLSYVECSVRLEREVGPLPDGWHLRPVAELDSLAGRGRRRLFARLDTTILLRTIGILAVVATHMRLWRVPGGAHILLTVAGFNIARFLLPIEPARERVRAGLRTVSRVAVPTVVWVGVGMLLTNAAFGTGTLLLVNNYVGPAGHQGDHWHFWFIEVFVHLVLVATLFGAVPAVRRTDRRWPYAFPLAILGATLVLRLEWFWFDDWFNFRYRTHSLAWFFVLGWIIQRSDSWPRRITATALCLALVPGAFDQPAREWFVIAAVVVLIWARELTIPRPLVRPIATVAAASMWILISHFTFWPPLKAGLPLSMAYALTIVAGVGVWSLAERALPSLVRLARRTIAQRRADDTLTKPGPLPA